MQSRLRGNKNGYLVCSGFTWCCSNHLLAMIRLFIFLCLFVLPYKAFAFGGSCPSGTHAQPVCTAQGWARNPDGSLVQGCLASTEAPKPCNGSNVPPEVTCNGPDCVDTPPSSSSSSSSGSTSSSSTSSGSTSGSSSGSGSGSSSGSPPTVPSDNPDTAPPCSSYWNQTGHYCKPVPGSNETSTQPGQVGCAFGYWINEQGICEKSGWNSGNGSSSGSTSSSGTTSSSGSSSGVNGGCSFAAGCDASGNPRPMETSSGGTGCPNGYSYTFNGNGTGICVPYNNAPSSSTSSSGSTSSSSTSSSSTSSSGSSSGTDTGSSSGSSSGLTGSSTSSSGSSGGCIGGADTCSGSDFCAKHPDLLVCKIPKVTANCDSKVWQCDGDAVNCTIAKITFFTACDNDNDDYRLRNMAKLMLNNTAPNSEPQKSDVNLQTSLNTVNPLGGSCPQDFQVQVMTYNLTVPMHLLCDGLELMGKITVAMSLIAAVFILFA